MLKTFYRYIGLLHQQPEILDSFDKDRTKEILESLHLIERLSIVEKTSLSDQIEKFNNLCNAAGMECISTVTRGMKFDSNESSLPRELINSIVISTRAKLNAQQKEIYTK